VKFDDEWKRMERFEKFFYVWFIFVAALAIASLITGGVVAGHFIAKFW
jgi:hypothetical protein